MEEDGGKVEEQMGEGRLEDDGTLCLGCFPFRRICRDLTLVGWMRLWLLRRWAILRRGAVPDL